MKNVITTIQDKYKNSKDFGISSLLQRKKKLLLWVASNCGSVPGARQRMDISNLLKNTKIGDNFDRRGSCFEKERFPMEKFKEYKFYLSMENSFHCKDYITEKLYRNGFLMEAVPVVWGSKKSDYHLPPNSVIFVEDYENMEELADYLSYLDRNDTAYLEYFQWRKIDVSNTSNYHVSNQKWCNIPAFQVGLCNLCGAVQKENLQGKELNKKRRIVDSIYSWIYETENPECLNGS